MQPTANLLKNNNIHAAYGAPQGVTNAIHQASARTGVDFAYLMNQAKAESSYNPAAKAKTSSASGLFQFIERTWLDMVNRHGDKYGLGRYAEAIDNRLRVGDRATRQDILALRNDPQIASFMAAEFAADNKAVLERTVGGQIGATELYLAHFLGASGASGFLREMRHNPMTIAADLMPKAARANRNVFYDSRTGQPRTLQQVYAFFDKKFADTPGQAPHMLAQSDVPLPARKPDIRQAKTGYQHIPPAQDRPVVFARDPGVAALTQAPDTAQKIHAKTLLDYRAGANQIPGAARHWLPVNNQPMSIADLLMLSAVDL